MDPFVVLRHNLPNHRDREDHWDLMLRHGDTLWTWAIDQLPCPSCVCEGIRLPDHDLKYLSYEGPVRRGGGTVKRVIAGRYRWLTFNPSAASTAQLIDGDRIWTMKIDSLIAERCQFRFE